MKNSRLLTIFIIVFVDLLGFSLILPLLPYYAEKYGASPFTVGLLVASYAAASLIGSPMLGRLSDRFGRRPILLVSVFGTLIGFLAHGKCGGGCWIGYVLEPGARGHGYGTEAVQLIVDYLFLHKDIGRIQAETHPANAVSRRVLAKANWITSFRAFSAF